ncbi:MAG TPA: hypothetical protein VFC18_09865, partial [Burkholderiales bacterium]|nr:hypothetical protein [Burkholderiales bacterium]
HHLARRATAGAADSAGRLDHLAESMAWIAVPCLHRLSYERLHAFAAHWPVKAGLVVVIGLSLWSAAHRLRITCYDLGVRADAAVAAIVYAGALAGTGAAVLYLLRI